jgi:GNAT superfamily N-acetyltransferase
MAAAKFDETKTFGFLSCILGVCIIACRYSWPMVFEVVVHPDFQRRGLATCMLKRALAALKEGGVPGADAGCVHAQQRAVRLHKPGLSAGGRESNVLYSCGAVTQVADGSNSNKG